MGRRVEQKPFAFGYRTAGKGIVDGDAILQNQFGKGEIVSDHGDQQSLVGVQPHDDRIIRANDGFGFDGDTLQHLAEVECARKPANGRDELFELLRLLRKVGFAAMFGHVSADAEYIAIRSWRVVVAMDV